MYSQNSSRSLIMKNSSKVVTAWKATMPSHNGAGHFELHAISLQHT